MRIGVERLLVCGPGMVGPCGGAEHNQEQDGRQIVRGLHIRVLLWWMAHTRGYTGGAMPDRGQRKKIWWSSGAGRRVNTWPARRAALWPGASILSLLPFERERRLILELPIEGQFTHGNEAVRELVVGPSRSERAVGSDGQDELADLPSAFRHWWANEGCSTEEFYDGRYGVRKACQSLGAALEGCPTCQLDLVSPDEEPVPPHSGRLSLCRGGTEVDPATLFIGVRV